MRLRTRIAITVGIVGLAAANTTMAASATTAPLPRYILTLDTNGIADYHAINNNGDILGVTTRASDGTDQAVLIKAGSTTPQRLLGANGSRLTRGMGLNNLGQAVGRDYNTNLFQPNSAERALEWSGTATGTLLPVATGDGATPNAINNNGDVVGETLTVSTPSTVGAWVVHDGKQTILPNLGRDAVPLAINDNGLIVGNSNGERQPAVAVEWRNGQLVRLGGLADGFKSNAVAVNNAGVAVGSAANAQGISVPAVFANGQVTHIPVPFEGECEAFANAINNHGDVVGQDGESNPFLYQNGQVISLASQVVNLGRALLGPAEGINDNGVIVGEAFPANPNMPPAVGYKLTPISGS